MESRTTLPSELKPESVVAICDTREQKPLSLSPLSVELGTLETGDYSIRGLEHVVRVERKSMDDLLGVVGRDRDRFDREVQRLLAYPVRVLVIEASWSDLESGLWQRSKVTPAQVVGSLLGWQAAGLSIHCVGDHARGRSTRSKVALYGGEKTVPGVAFTVAMVHRGLERKIIGNAKNIGRSRAGYFGGGLGGSN